MSSVYALWALGISYVRLYIQDATLYEQVERDYHRAIRRSSPHAENKMREPPVSNMHLSFISV